MSWNSGAVISWWDGNRLALGIVDGQEKQRVRVLGATGKSERVRPTRIGWTLEAGGDSDVARLDAIEAVVAERAQEVDAALLWELLGEAEGEEAATTLEALADLALGAADGFARAAVARALLDDGIHFYRKAEQWVARSPTAVERLQLERERVAEREREKVGLFVGAAAAVREEPFDLGENETVRKYLGALTELAVAGDGVRESQRRVAAELIAASGVAAERDHEGAFRLLRLFGAIESDHANLSIPRYELRVDFPPELPRSFPEPDGGGRVDRRAMPIVTIDGPRTREIDDAIWAERTPHGFRVEVHIAEPSALVAPGDPLDDEAAQRGLTHYFPDGKILMLPPELSEQAASLVPNQRRAALSFLCDIAADGSLVELTIERSWIESKARLSYDEVDALLDGDAESPWRASLEAAHAAASARAAWRLDRGAIHLGGEEAEIVVDDERPRIELRRRDAPSQLLVAEAMILVGEGAASRLDAEGLAAVYRWQPEPKEPIAPTERAANDAVTAQAVRRRLRRGETGRRARPHASLGLDAYVQVTSPLRRYQDLVLQRQLVAHLLGRPAPYDDEAMQRISATTEAAERQARRAEREADDYWMRVWLAEREGQTIGATVLAAEPRPLVQLDECLWNLPLRAAARCAPGDRLTLAIRHVNPRAGVVHLQMAE